VFFLEYQEEFNLLCFEQRIVKSPTPKEMCPPRSAVCISGAPLKGMKVIWMFSFLAIRSIFT
jgi:hypothetical protein